MNLYIRTHTHTHTHVLNLILITTYPCKHALKYLNTIFLKYLPYIINSLTHFAKNIKYIRYIIFFKTV